MTVPLAEDMAAALDQMGASLVNHGLILSNNAFCKAASYLRRQKGKRSWAYEIAKSEKIEFSETQNSDINKPIRVKIYSDLNIRQVELADKICFEKLDLALEVWSADRLLIKHHVDRSNKKENGEYQEGPLFHLQFGGHSPGGQKDHEVAIKEPRWFYLPMDLILLCELVVANFYPDKWQEIQHEAGWKDAIISSQKFCFIPFIATISRMVNTSDDTLLSQLWAENSAPSYATHGF